ncbi:PDZ domain-containing protein [bacterium]|nr:PDZ domain-containing protein [bacterium]
MKFSYIVIFWAAQSLLAGAQPAESRVPQARQTPQSSRAPHAWLGLRVAKPDETITAHVPSLPPGIGFVVKSVDEGGPAQSAGLTEFDLLWKFGDQMLVNEAQLATLLRLAKPGDEVVISGFRGGKPLELKLKLGEAPVLEKPLGGEMVESAILPGVCPGPMRLVNVAEKTASFSADEGRAVVRREGEVYKVRIDGPTNEQIFDGEVAQGGALEHVPDEWRRRVKVLCRTLDQALDGGMLPQRQPRPRVVPPASEKP